MNGESSWRKPINSSPYEALLRAGLRLRNLQQVHAHLITTGSLRHSLPILTKLATFAITAGALQYVRQLFLCIPNPDAFFYSSIINSTSKSHFSRDTLFFYRHMLLSNTSPSNYTFTAVIKACSQLASMGTGRAVHCQVLIYGYGVDRFVQAALVSFYAKCRDLRIARKLFDEMPERTIVAWNSMISGYEQNGFAHKAIALFYKMRDLGVAIDSPTLVSVLSACAQVGALDLGYWVHEYVIHNEYNLTVVLGTALTNMYAKCGNVSKARLIFDSINERNVMTWTAMISGYGMHGYGREAIELFQLMRTIGPPPNNVTFIAALSACSHAGLVREGREVFASMSRDYGIVPEIEHHVCMVDMLGRGGLLNEAFQYINELNPVKPTTAMWTSLLGACKMHKNIDLGVQVAEQLFNVEPENPGHYVLLSNMYALAGLMDRVEMVRNVMIRKGLKKQVGYSIIEVDQRTYLFSMGDKSHPKMTAIYKYLDELMQRSKDAGYVPASESVMHELEEEEKEYALRYHSEKLAIAFGLLETSEGMVIRIVKNLRMCEDCHIATKFISVVSNREIVVRDKLRFHHFKDGSCSCMDYW